MTEQHGRARQRPTPGPAWLELLINPGTLVALHSNIWIIACNVPGKYPLSIKAFIYLSRTLNISAFNAVMFDVMDSLFVFQDFFSLAKGGVRKEKYLLHSSQIEKDTGPLFYLFYPKYFCKAFYKVMSKKQFHVQAMQSRMWAWALNTFLNPFHLSLPPLRLVMRFKREGLGWGAAPGPSRLCLDAELSSPELLHSSNTPILPTINRLLCTHSVSSIAQVFMSVPKPCKWNLSS